MLITTFHLVHDPRRRKYFLNLFPATVDNLIDNIGGARPNNYETTFEWVGDGVQKNILENNFCGSAYIPQVNIVWDCKGVLCRPK